jgi:hypothetical protein
VTWGRAIRIGSKIFLGTCPADLPSAMVQNCVIVMWGGLWCVCEHARRLAKCVIVMGVGWAVGGLWLHPQLLSAGLVQSMPPNLAVGALP